MPAIRFCALLFFLFGGTVYGEGRPQVCTITINSSDERDIFREHLGKEFDFVELTSVPGVGRDWFYRACQQGIQCDILLISGHFAGVFFGRSGHRLSLEELQRRACDSACDGILKRPREVFLFGCNTVAGKESDGRTSEQYTQVLVESGFSRGLAERMSAFRYSAIGQQTQQRMRQVFSHAIYGFHSKSPLGHQMRRPLEQYFHAISGGNYVQHLKGLSLANKNQAWNRTMKGLSIRSVNGSDWLENPVCILEGNRPIYQKLDWVRNSVADQQRILAYIPVLDSYLQDLERKFGPTWDGFPTLELAALESIQFNHRARERVMDVLEAPDLGILNAQVQVLNFTKRVGWQDEENYGREMERFVGHFFEENLDKDDRDSLCSLGVTLDLQWEQLPAGEWNEWTAYGIGCIRPRDPQIHQRLGEMLSSPKRGTREAALWALGESGTDDPEISLKVLKLFKESDRILRARAGQALVKMHPRHPRVYRALVELLKEPRWRTEGTWIVEKISWQNPRDYAPLLELLKERDERVRGAAAWILEGHRPSGDWLQQQLLELMQNPHRGVCSTASRLLSQLNPSLLMEKNKGSPLRECPYMSI